MSFSESQRVRSLCAHVLASSPPQDVPGRDFRRSLDVVATNGRDTGSHVALGKVLIANRSVAAIRIAHAAQELGLKTVAIFDPEEDASALHRRLCDEAIGLRSANGVAPYLNAQTIIAAAKEAGADCIHPGYGFLAESADFARQCADANLIFIGPPVAALSTWGDKTHARALAAALQPPVPTLFGSDVAFESAEQAIEFVVNSNLADCALMLKAAHGGGGRGMRRIPAGTSKEDFIASFSRAHSEAINAFGSGGIFVEELLERCRHIEVQVIASASGEVAHLFERDCSVQMAQGYKVVEICPAAAMEEKVRLRLLEDAVRLISATPGGYRNAGTVEFLVEVLANGECGRHVFIEVNPRLQVEHGITEEVCGVDIVRAQFLLAQGFSLHRSLNIPQEERKLFPYAAVPAPTSWAVEVRLCLTAPPQDIITQYHEPGGRGVRMESAIQIGMRPSGKYDPMLALAICWDRTLESALARAAHCLDDLEISGVQTNLALLQDILRSSELHSAKALTTTVSWTLAKEAPPIRRLKPVLDANIENPVRGEPLMGVATDIPPDAVCSPLAGMFRWEVEDGQNVQAGETIAAVLAMKIETPVRAPTSGCVRFHVQDNVEIHAGDIVAVLEEVDADAASPSSSSAPIDQESCTEQPSKWAKIVSERAHRNSLALQMGGEEILNRRRSDGQLNIRERILATLDPGTFREAGPVAGKMHEGGMMPANFVLGTGRIFGRPVVIGGEDFTIQGGSPNVGGLQKSVFTERLALQLRIPLVRLHEGGGGAVAGGTKKLIQPEPTSAPIVESTRFGTVAGCLGVVPVVSAALGTVAGLPASRLVASHFVVALKTAQILVAGPRFAASADGRRLSKDDLGGESVHKKSGVVDNYVANEADAFVLIRNFLSFLPSNVDGLPPCSDSCDHTDRREEALLTIIPEDRGPYDMRQLIKLVVDRDNGSLSESGDGSSFFEIGTCQFGQEIITGLARVGGQPIGIFANDPMHLNGAMTWQASIKTRRLIELCATFHLPIITFVDQPGFMVGLQAEEAGTMRFGTSAVLAAQSAPVPWCTVQVRKAYGVAGAAHYGPNAHVLVWPSAEQGVVPVEAGVQVKYRRQLEAAPPGERRKLERRLVAEHSKALSPWVAVESFGAWDLIDPRDTRPRLCEWIDMAKLQLPALASATCFPYRP